MVLQSSPVSDRRITVSSRRLRADHGAAELLVHALAQLPDAASAELPDSTPQRRKLELLAEAYGVHDRLSFTANVAESGPLDDLLAGDVSLGEIVEKSYTQDDQPASTRRGDDSVFRGQRVAIVTNLATHYRAPLFDLMRERLSAAGAEMRVFLLARRAADREWTHAEDLRVEHEFVRSIDVGRRRGRRLLPLDLASRIEHFRPTILLVGGFSPFTARPVASYARRRGIPLGVWSGEIASRPTAKSRIRHRQRSRLTKRAAFAIAYGTESARYLRTLRGDLPIVIGRNTTLTPPTSSREGAESPHLLVVSRAEQQKRLDLVIDALRSLSDVRLDVTVVGDGPELDRLKARASDLPFVQFLGNVPPSQVRPLYTTADVFLFPSAYDVFGLVLVEAMGAGLCVLTSPAPGAVMDLVVHRTNGLVTPADVNSWSSTLNHVIGDSSLRRALGAAAGRTIRRRWTLDHAADAMLAGLRLGLLSRRTG